MGGARPMGAFLHNSSSHNRAKWLVRFNSECPEKQQSVIAQCRLTRFKHKSDLWLNALYTRLHWTRYKDVLVKYYDLKPSAYCSGLQPEVSGWALSGVTEHRCINDVDISTTLWMQTTRTTLIMSPSSKLATRYIFFTSSNWSARPRLNAWNCRFVYWPPSNRHTQPTWSFQLQNV